MCYIVGVAVNMGVAVSMGVIYRGCGSEHGCAI